MAKKRRGRAGRFLGIPYNVASSDAFGSLRGPETKLILDILLQYNGNNNGMLSACYALMQKRGWAKSSLHAAFNKLQHAGFLVVTRQGWKVKGKATLVAITWEGIDEPKSDLRYDNGITASQTPLAYWCTTKTRWEHKPKAKEITKKKINSSPQHVSTKEGNSPQYANQNCQ